jgi:hypothetical protein
LGGRHDSPRRSRWPTTPATAGRHHRAGEDCWKTSAISASWSKFLPYTESDLKSIFSSVDIALDELELPENFEEDHKPEAAPEKAAKTHTIMRFKVTIADSEKITELSAKIQKRQGFTAADELTNAGDALVHVMFGGSGDVSQS